MRPFSQRRKYEGNWKEGRTHGFGKVIGSDGIIHEGEWKEGKKHGKGRVIYKDGYVSHQWK